MNRCKKKLLCAAGIAFLLTALSLDALSTANQVLHFDASTNAYRDDVGTPAGDGDKVRVWTGSGTLAPGVSLSQDTESSRPTLIANAVNGRPALRFHRGESNALSVDRGRAEGIGALLDTNTITWTFVMRAASHGAGQQWIASIHFDDGDFPYGDLNSIITAGGGGRLGANMKDQNDVLRDAPPNYIIANDVWYVVSVVWDGNTGRLAQYVNGQRTGIRENEAVRDLPLVWEYLALGNRFIESHPFDGDIAEFVLYNAALNDQDRLANERHLAEKYGLGPVTAMPFTADFGQVRLLNVLSSLTAADYDLGVATVGTTPFIDDDLTDEVVPATNNDRVRFWRNQSPLGSDVRMIQNTLSKRPTFIEDAINGYPAVKFERDRNQVLVLSRSAGGAGIGTELDTNQVTWTFVAKSTERTAGQQWIVSQHFQGGDAGYGDVNTIITGGGQLGANMRDNNNALRDAVPNYSFDNDTWMVVSLVWDGVSGRIAQYVNGEQTGVRENIAYRNLPQTFEWLVLGNRHNEIRPWSGEIAELILYNSALSDEDRLANERWLSQKYGVGAIDGAAPPALLTDGQVIHLDAAAGVETPDPEGSGGIVSLPSELEGKIAIRTSNLQSDWGDSIYLAFELDRPVTVYVAKDPASTPAWLSGNFTQTAMIIETTGGNFNVWAREYGEGDFVMLPGNKGHPDDHNYWVILSESPGSITDSPDFFMTTPSGEWSLGRRHWQLTTNPTSALHTSTLVTSVSNFTPENGFRLTANFRVPQLQHDGQNSYGLLLFGEMSFGAGGFFLDSSKGIRAEWLPREANGGSTLRLVDHETGSVIPGAGATVAWNGAKPTRTNDYVAGDDHDLFWDSRASELVSHYFIGDEEKAIVRMPDALDPNFFMEGVMTVNDLSNSSENFLQFQVESGDPGDGNPGVTVFVAWDIRNSGFEPDWLRQDFTRTDHFVQVSGGALYHRLWAREYSEGSLVTLPGASYGGAGPFPEGTDNYFVLLGDTRAGLEEVYIFEATGFLEDGEWVISATLTDGSGFSETVTTTVAGSFPGQNVFGVAVRQPSQADGSQTPVTPIWQTFDLSLDFFSEPGAGGFVHWLKDFLDNDQMADPEISAPGAAPAGDGVANLLKYALNLHPLEPVALGSLFHSEVDENGHLLLAYWERTDVNDIDYVPEVSDDLQIWRSGPGNILEVFRESGANGIDEVVVRGSLPAEAGRGFLRLKIQQRE